MILINLGKIAVSVSLLISLIVGSAVYAEHKQPPDMDFFIQISLGNNDGLKSYLEKGGDPNILAVGDIPLLKSVISFRNEEAALLLLKYGAEIPDDPKEQYSILVRVGDMGSGKLLLQLIKKNIDVGLWSLEDSVLWNLLGNCMTYAYCKTDPDYFESVKIAFNRIDLSQSLTKEMGKPTALHYVSRYNNDVAYQLMVITLEKGIDPNQPSDFGNFALENTIRNGDYKSTKLLLDKGADPKLISNFHWLRESTQKKHPEIIELLKSYGY